MTRHARIVTLGQLRRRLRQAVGVPLLKREEGSYWRKERAMKWVTREHPKTDRIACPWLIRKFIDPDAEIVYVAREEVLAYAEREGATSFDAPGATYTHSDGRCSFETLVEAYNIDDPAIALMARVVHGADVAEDRDATPESRGLLAIADGFALLDMDDQRQLKLELPVYDALYAWAQAQVTAARSSSS
jgi:hypothetical protein